jgi:indolepyruvate ferredoxin oxidoreductase alpha subunit
MSLKDERILMGNEAMGRGLVECGCEFFAAYPGTPSSEILASAVGFAKETAVKMHLEWSVNEKVAYEAALAASYTGKRSAVAMKQVGLNVAADPFMRSAYLGTKGGFVLIAADDPGPHSSQTEQDSRSFAQFAKIPVLDPSSPAEAKAMVQQAFDLSEKYEIPVMLRPTTRVCHARQNVSCDKPEILERTPRFEKDPGRWIATPQFIPELHTDRAFLPGTAPKRVSASSPRALPLPIRMTFWMTWGFWERSICIRSHYPIRFTKVLSNRFALPTTMSWSSRKPIPLSKRSFSIPA